MLPYCFALLTPIVIAFEISHYNPEYRSGPNASDDLIYLETQPIADVTNVRNQIDGLQCDVNDFIELIPAKEVQHIIGNYYYNDNEVQRAYTYLQSKDFLALKERILNIQEVNDFLKYLNQTGLDVLGLMNTLTNLMGDPKTFNQPHQMGTENSTVTGGLHGLVDDVLDILPQDQVLSLFFEKLETSDEFSNLVERIGSEEFSYILQDMEDSTELRNLVYTLHNNGIYIGRIIDSMKGYFFLGGF